MGFYSGAHYMGPLEGRWAAPRGFPWGLFEHSPRIGPNWACLGPTNFPHSRLASIQSWPYVVWTVETLQHHDVGPSLKWNGAQCHSSMRWVHARISIMRPRHGCRAYASITTIRPRHERRAYASFSTRLHLSTPALMDRHGAVYRVLSCTVTIWGTCDSQRASQITCVVRLKQATCAVLFHERGLGSIFFFKFTFSMFWCRLRWLEVHFQSSSDRNRKIKNIKLKNTIYSHMQDHHKT